MRFELVVWHEAKPLSREQAAERHREFANGADAPPHPGVTAFADALSAAFPDVDIEAHPGHATVTMAPEVADAVSTEAYPLARQHALICYDPVRDLVHNLEPTGAYPDMQLRTGDGLMIVNPDLNLVNDALATLSPQNPFLALVVFGHHFLQVSPDADGYELEYRDSVAGRMHRTAVPDLAEIQRCFAEYATDDRSFLTRHSWTVS
jgi:hypothetical protein